MFTGFASPKRPTQNPEPDPLPTFGSQGRRFRVVTNDTVVLPCDVINPGECDLRCVLLNIKIFLIRYYIILQYIIKIYFRVLSTFFFLSDDNRQIKYKTVLINIGRTGWNLWVMIVNNRVPKTFKKNDGCF